MTTAEALRLLAPLVRRTYDDRPGERCWAPVRDGLRLLGVAMPDRYEDAAGMGRSLGRAGARFARLGDVVFLEGRVNPGESRGEHVGLCLGDGRFLHATRDHGVVVDRLAPLVRAGLVVDLARPAPLEDAP
ncbi:MAG: NlpC/P60 family protein [Microbacteriaceae bacterium]